MLPAAWAGLRRAGGDSSSEGAIAEHRLLMQQTSFGLTCLSQILGNSFYGYGYAVSLLSRIMDRLSYEIFMFQPGPAAIKRG